VLTLKALTHNEWRTEPVDPELLGQLVLVCLENLATLAQGHGEGRRATRLLDAAGLLRCEAQATVNSGELTQREWQVAFLVARGASNRQIALELIVSERTVDTHVSHILHKLELTSRAQIATWVTERQGRFRVLQ
jgi:DNA-binding NarL/FixJ family response regulator